MSCPVYLGIGAYRSLLTAFPPQIPDLLEISLNYFPHLRRLAFFSSAPATLEANICALISRTGIDLCGAKPTEEYVG